MSHAAAGRWIELDRFLKAMEVAESGGEAKHLVRSGAVRVNDDAESRRGRKLRTDDVVEVEDPEDGRRRRFRVDLDEAADGTPPGTEIPAP